ncbi:MAG: hypothetical protein UT62_C0030G0001 [Parcubacteria group bacterium GW2011_GWC1_39_8]|nr:MAG: hypothetical protein UT62_C0030G0001 [Parcubacteria group bacterium GW2011_GWC1_39_8]
MPSIMTSRQSAELDHAFERNGWTSEDVKKLSGGDILATFLLVIRDRAEVVVRSILTLLRTVHIASQPAGITSEKYFEEVGVQRTSSNFKSQFYGLEVAATDEVELTVYKLEENSLDASILAELGDKTETSVSQFQSLSSTPSSQQTARARSGSSSTFGEKMEISGLCTRAGTPATVAGMSARTPSRV